MDLNDQGLRAVFGAVYLPHAIALRDEMAREIRNLRDERDVNNRCWHDAEDRLARAEKRAERAERAVKMIGETLGGKMLRLCSVCHYVGTERFCYRDGDTMVPFRPCPSCGRLYNPYCDRFCEQCGAAIKLNQ